MAMETRALQAERDIVASQNKQDALETATHAAELYMKAMQVSSTREEKSRLKAKCMAAFSRAEQIKKLKQWPPAGISISNGRSPRSIQQLQAPVSERVLSTQEKLIILKGSRLHGSEFPPWIREPNSEDFNAAKELYRDPHELSISSEHQIDFARWQRPGERLMNELNENAPLPSPEPTMIAQKEIDLVQDITADCSVVASLCAVLAQSQGACRETLYGNIFPFDHILNTPVLSDSGKYIFRFNFNGSYRKVVIDDRLPTSRTERTLHVVDRNNPGLLWPALLEKAYLKIRGGYDFPGSNSGTDLFVLTSWIPEQLFLQSEDFQGIPAWNRFKKAFGFGDVVATLGTGRLSKHEEAVLGLVAEHDYAVLDLKEEGNEKLLLVKNPWCNGVEWTSSEGIDPLQSRLENLRLSSKHTLRSGTFWIAFQEVATNFNSMYLNWNPSLFKFREDYHFDWKIPVSASPRCFTYNPQYAVSSETGDVVWVLLSRHFKTDEDRAVPRRMGYIGLCVFDTEGQRVHLSDSPLIRGPEVDSPQTLVKLEMARRSCYTVVVTQQALPLEQYSFTLSAYSGSQISIRPASKPYSHETSQDGAWTSKTAGGNSDAASHFSNPQYRLHVHSLTALNLVLEAAPQEFPVPHELPVHVRLMATNGERATSVSTQCTVAESGEYRRGCAVASSYKVAAGLYTIVCSTFDAGQTGTYKLSVESMAPCELTLLPRQDAGRLVTCMPSILMSGGCDRRLAPISMSRITRLKATVNHISSGGIRRAQSPLKVSFEVGQGPHKRVLSVSNNGIFSDALGGVRTIDVDAGTECATSGGLWLVVERLGSAGAVDELRVEILSDAPVEAGEWGVGSG